MGEVVAGFANVHMVDHSAIAAVKQSPKPGRDSDQETKAALQSDDA